MTAAEIVAAHLAARYAHPGRAAYLYLFQLQPGADFEPLVPEPGAIRAAWIDEGNGLSPVPPEAAAIHCQEALSGAPALKRAQSLTSEQRRRLMARVVLFVAIQSAPDRVEVRLLSRALILHPKGTREAFEEWHPLGEGGDWYSAYRPE